MYQSIHLKLKVCDSSSIYYRAGGHSCLPPSMNNPLASLFPSLPYSGPMWFASIASIPRHTGEQPGSSTAKQIMAFLQSQRSQIGMQWVTQIKLESVMGCFLQHWRKRSFFSTEIARRQDSWSCPGGEADSKQSEKGKHDKYTSCFHVESKNRTDPEQK